MQNEPAMKREGVTRRAFLGRAGMLATGAVAAAASPALLTSCSSSSKSKNEVVYAGFGGAYQQQITKAVLKPFQDATGIKVTITTGAENIASLKANVKANKVQWDVMDTNIALLAQAIAADVLQKIDYSGVKSISDLNNKSLAGPYGLGYYNFSDNIWWNPRAVKGQIRTWADVWNTSAFPGKRGFGNTVNGLLEGALMASGTPTDKIYPIDVDKAFAWMDKIRSSSTFLDSTADQNAMAQQDSVIGFQTLSRIKAVTQAGTKLDYSWDQVLIDTNSFAIPKQAPHVDNAVKLMEFALQPEQQLAIMRILGYSPATKTAIAKLTPTQLKNIPTSPQNSRNAVYYDSAWYAKHGADATQRFQKWLIS